MKTIDELVNELVSGREIEKYWIAPQSGSEQLRFVDRQGKKILQYHAKVSITFKEPTWYSGSYIQHITEYLWIDIPVEKDNYE